MTVEEWSKRWLVLFPHGDQQNGLHVRSRVQTFVRAFGDRRLDGISVLEARAWAAENPGAVRYVRMFFKDAVLGEVIRRSPFENVPVVKSTGRAGIDPPTVEEVARFAHVAPELLGEWGHTFAAMIFFSAYSGLRLKETCMLEARDIQLVPHATVHVRFPKRPAPERTVGVYGPGEFALRGMLPEVGLVFPSPTGRVLSREKANIAWRRLREDLEVGYTWHQLRHFCATWLLDQGASDLDVALQLGHQDNGTLVRHLYGHPKPELAIARLREVVNG